MNKCFLIFTLAAGACLAATPDWVAKSNRNAQVLLETRARFFPESAGRDGVAGVDEQILDLKPDASDRRLVAIRADLKTLAERLQSEKDPLVRQDLEILIGSAQDSIRGIELGKKYTIPYSNVAQTIFSGLQGLLDDQVAPERRRSALVRLRRYTGLEKGYTPLTALAEQRTRERLNQPGLLGPAKAEVEQDLANSAAFVDGVGKLFEKYKIAGYQEAHAKLKEQIAAYNDFVRKDVLPKSRVDFRLPAELYDFSLRQYGVDIPATELASIAHAAFNQIRDEMKTLAPQIARQRGWKLTDYRDVIRELKKDQLVGDQILPHYHKRIAEIEDIIRREKLVTLPNRAARMILASPAETAAQPAPHMRPPRLIGNTGESGVFVLPLNVPGVGGASQRYDDFTFAAASWTLTCHEVRPGHEMQFAAMVENGVSQARGIFAFNSTNVEGWGLYSEFIMRPFMPVEGQLISLQHRMMRAARAFLDPELHMGKVTPAEALRVLQEDVMLSPAMATQEVERYTFRMPGQATSYFYGFTRLSQLRAETEREMGSKFNQQKYHDFILSQGLLPPALLRKAVFADFIGRPLAL